jgi:two-component system LytT family response regulator
MKLLRALLVDDDPIALCSLRALLGAHPEVLLVGEAQTARAALAANDRLQPEVTFLDIELPDGSGFDLVEKISGRVVFVTAHNEFALRAFEVNALDYLVKPVSPERLAATITRLLTSAPAATEPFRPTDLAYLPLTKGRIFLQVGQIAAIESHRNRSIVIAVDARRFVVRRSLSAWEKLLPGDQFFRINRKTILHRSQIRELQHRGSSTWLLLPQLDKKYSVTRRRFSQIRPHLPGA